MQEGSIIDVVSGVSVFGSKFCGDVEIPVEVGDGGENQSCPDTKAVRIVTTTASNAIAKVSF